MSLHSGDVSINQQNKSPGGEQIATETALRERRACVSSRNRCRRSFEPKIVRCPHCAQTVTTRVNNYFDWWPALAMLWCVHICSSYLHDHTTSTQARSQDLFQGGGQQLIDTKKLLLFFKSRN